MKVANKESIETGEKELLDTIIAELDWEVIEKKLKEKHNIRLQEDVEFNNGDLVVHGNKIAYKLNFDVKITLAVIFDRLGECISISAAGSDEEIDEGRDDEEIEAEEFTPPNRPVNEENDKMAEDLSGMIDEINSDEE